MVEGLGCSRGFEWCGRSGGDERVFNVSKKYCLIFVALSHGEVVEWQLPNLMVRWLTSGLNEKRRNRSD